VKYGITAKVSTNGIDINKISDGAYFSMNFGELYVEGNLSVKNGKKIRSSMMKMNVTK